MNQKTNQVAEKVAKWAANMQDEALKAQLAALSEEEQYECFYTDLAFGTGGIRGVMGVGTNRMNRYVVARATQGLANMLLQKTAAPKVVIGYDSRHMSDQFAKAAAAVLAANGAKVFLYPQLMPTPFVSFGVRTLGADAGIMVTASHNPAKYNGYKVFGSDGCQMNLTDSEIVMDEIQKLDFFEGVQQGNFEKALADGRIEYISEAVTKAFLEAVLALRLQPQLLQSGDMKMVYTPLNGAGNLPVRAALAKAGVKDLFVVKEQELPDGDFPTCPFPNPEIAEALELAVNLAKEKGADLVLATDPDADRIGIAIPHKGAWTLLNGNQVGVLLTHYLLSYKQAAGILPKDPMVIKTIVSTPLTDAVAEHYGAKVKDVLTGFKFIGEQIRLLEGAGEIDRYQLGFEESYGYLPGGYVRDKDAVGAALLICEMTAHHRKAGKDLLDVLEELYQTFGYYLTSQDNLYFEGSDGMAKMSSLMADLLSNPPTQLAGVPVVCQYDYAAGKKTDLQTGEIAKLDLPSSKVLKLVLANRCEVMVRPSGTEPKIKVYYTAVGEDAQKAQALLELLGAEMKQKLS